ncbi:MAG TPA: hypothetical protein VD968_16795 [Pyrinomonadaceae bacterium]|nr:hypothetical protein [Pyrinomonadaceae bacterium]
MKTRLTLLAVAAVLGTAWTIFFAMPGSPRLRPAQAQGQDPGFNFTFEGLAQRAISDGQPAVKISTTIDDIDVTTLDDAMARYSVITVQPSLVAPYRTGDLTIESWSKMTITETLSSRPFVPPCESCAQPPPKPGDFPDANWNEILTSEVGGTISVNGVTFTQTTGIPLFNANEQYVLFVNINPSNRVATVIGGGFRLLPGGYMSPLDTSDNQSVIVTEVAARFNNSLDQLRAALQ